MAIQLAPCHAYGANPAWAPRSGVTARGSPPALSDFVPLLAVFRHGARSPSRKLCRNRGKCAVERASDRWSRRIFRRRGVTHDAGCNDASLAVEQLRAKLHLTQLVDQVELADVDDQLKVAGKAIYRTAHRSR